MRFRKAPCRCSDRKIHSVNTLEYTQFTLNAFEKKILDADLNEVINVLDASDGAYGFICHVHFM